jgi:hypothetical protein
LTASEVKIILDKQYVPVLRNNRTVMHPASKHFTAAMLTAECHSQNWAVDVSRYKTAYFGSIFVGLPHPQKFTASRLHWIWYLYTGFAFGMVIHAHAGL